jgi:hypothetical protein
VGSRSRGETEGVPRVRSCDNLSEFSTDGSTFMSIVRQARMVSSGDNGVYTGLGLRGVIPYVQCVVCRVPEPSVLAVGFTSWSGEGVRFQVPGGGV